MGVNAAVSGINFLEIMDGLGKMDEMREGLEAAFTGGLSPLEIAANNLKLAEKAWENDKSYENFSKLQVARNAYGMAYKGASPADIDKIMESTYGDYVGTAAAEAAAGADAAAASDAFKRDFADAQTSSDKTRDSWTKTTV